MATVATDRGEPGVFTPILDALTLHGDHYMHLADLTSYVKAQEQAGELYRRPDAWAKDDPQRGVLRPVLQRPDDRGVRGRHVGRRALPRGLKPDRPRRPIPPSRSCPPHQTHRRNPWNCRTSQSSISSTAAAGDRRVRRPLRPQGRAPRAAARGRPAEGGPSGRHRGRPRYGRGLRGGGGRGPRPVGGRGDRRESRPPPAARSAAGAPRPRPPRRPTRRRPPGTPSDPGDRATTSRSWEVTTAEARKFLGALEHVTVDLAALACLHGRRGGLQRRRLRQRGVRRRGPQRLRPAAPPEARPLPGAGRADRPVAGRAARPPLNREPSVDRPEWTHEGLVDGPREDRRIRLTAGRTGSPRPRAGMGRSTGWGRGRGSRGRAGPRSWGAPTPPGRPGSRSSRPATSRSTPGTPSG